ncbi:MAG: hypothetical protein AB3X41_02820 [Leptothrix ochracea]|uniref:hypothetical protein n=1 Tax=Leptothrix ochracea TaxID=735331 RepID=UPI0034E1DD7E
MKKSAFLALSSLTVLLASLAAPAHAGEWTFLPILKPGYKAAPSLALTVNSNDASSQTTDAVGLDFNFNCGLVQSPDQRIRTHFNLSQSDKNGTKVTGYELSPRYTIPFGDGMSAGFGPSLAAFSVDQGATSTTLYGVGAAAGVNYRAGMLFAGADLRIHSTSIKNGVDYSPTSLGLKIGVNF